MASADTFWYREKESLQRLKTELERSSVKSRLSKDVSRYKKPIPSHLPGLHVPPASPTLRGKNYDVVPPLQLSTTSKEVDSSVDGYDSWAENFSDSDDAEQAAVAPSYPIIIYPMVLTAPPDTNSSSHPRRRQRDPNGKIASTGKTIVHQDPFIVNPNKNQIHGGNQGSFQSPQRRRRSRQNVDVNQKGSAIGEQHLEEPDRISDSVIEVIDTEQLRNSVSLKPRHQYTEWFSTYYPLLNSDPLEDFLDDLFEDVIAEEAISILREYNRGHFDDRLERVTYDYILKEILTETARQAVDDVRAQKVRKVAPDKAHQKNDMQVKNMASEKVMESIFLDYMMMMFTKQNQLGTKDEYANHLLDDFLLTILLKQHRDVTAKQSATIDNKPLRRFHERIVTDVALDVILRKLSQSLDADMVDIDLNERDRHN